MPSQLAVLISKSGVKAGILRNDLWSFKSLHYNSSREPEIKEELSVFFKDITNNEAEFDEYSFSYFSEKFTLIPNAIFEGNTAEEFFKFSFNELHNSNDIDYNRISELSLVNVFEMPLWIKSFFVIRFPRIVMQHELSYQLRGIFSGSTFKLKIHLTLFDSEFAMVVSKENNLLLANVYEFQNADDIIYLLSNCLNKMELGEQSGELILSDFAENHKEIIKNVLENSVKISHLQKLKITEAPNFPFENQKLCV